MLICWQLNLPFRMPNKSLNLLHLIIEQKLHGNNNLLHANNIPFGTSLNIVDVTSTDIQ